MKNKIVIVGGIPAPIGGVTNFVYRLVSNNASTIAAVIDIYDTRNKIELDNYEGDYHIIPKGFFRVFVLAALLRKYKNNTIFFNFSRSYAFLLLMFLPKLNSCSWVLMLHHGDLQILNKAIRFVLKLVILLTRRKIDKVLALSDEQRKFYEEHSFRNILNTTSYIPCRLPLTSFGYIQQIVSNLRSRGRKIIIASGFPRKIYNHSWVVDFAKQNNTALFLFLYGDGECMQTLYDSCAKVEDCFLFYECSEPSFNYALSQTDVYVRPNDIDSFGIACADAVTLGIKVLASDVCDRYRGCVTYHHNEGKNEFVKKLSKIISSSYTPPNVERNKVHFSINLLY